MNEDVTLAEIRKQYKNMMEGDKKPLNESTTKGYVDHAGQGINPIKGYGDKKVTEVDRAVGAEGGADIAGSKGTVAKTGENVEVKSETQHGTEKNANDVVTGVKRGQGVKDAQPESLKADIGNKAAAGKDGGVPRGEGVEDADKIDGVPKGLVVDTGETKEGGTPFSEFRNKVRSILGLEANKKIMTSPLNDGNKGLNQGHLDKKGLEK